MTTVLDTSVRMCGVTLHASNELTKSRIFIEPISQKNFTNANNT